MSQPAPQTKRSHTWFGIARAVTAYVAIGGMAVFVFLFVADLTAYTLEARPLPTSLAWNYIAQPIVHVYQLIGNALAHAYYHIVQCMHRLFGNAFNALFNSLFLVGRIFIPVFDVGYGFADYVRINMAYWKWW